MPNPTYSELTKQLGPEDYEEAKLLEAWDEATEHASHISLTARRALEKNGDQAVNDIVAKLGYDPMQGRPARPRGRIRVQAMPDPLPRPGTKMFSCLGDEYEVFGYAYQPLTGKPNMVLYYDHQGRQVVRSTAHLFAGSLSTNEPFVTWPEDPRKLQPGKPIPQNKRRALSKKQLREDEHADPSTLPLTEAEKRRRY